MHSVALGAFLAVYAVLNVSAALFLSRNRSDSPGELERTMATSCLAGLVAIANLLPEPFVYRNAVRIPLVVVGLATATWFFYRSWRVRRNAGR